MILEFKDILKKKEIKYKRKGNVFNINGKNLLFLKVKENELLKNSDTVIISPKEYKQYNESEDCKIIFSPFDTDLFFVSNLSNIIKNEYYYEAKINYDEIFDIEDYVINNKKQNFVHLHNHFEYSQLDGTLTSDMWLQECKRKGFSSIALTDHGTLAGIFDFYYNAKKYNIKPILGIEIYITENLKERGYNHLTLLAKNNIGWRNLLKLNTYANIEGYYYKPRITYEKLKEHSEGLIILTGCPYSKFSYLLLDGKINGALKLYDFYKNCVGEENVYLELQIHDYTEKESKERQNKILRNFYKFYIKNKINRKFKIVLTNDCHFVKKEDYIVFNAIAKISKNNENDLIDKNDNTGIDIYLKTRKELYKTFNNSILKKKNMFTNNDFKMWCENTVKIAESTNVEIPIGKHNLPEFKLNNNINKKKFFIKVIKDGFEEKIINKWSIISKNNKKISLDDYKERLNKEMKVIIKAEFIDYFLIIWDIIKIAKERSIFVGAARGSVAGSLVAYVMDITDIDPIKFDLLFERFLNETRVSGERAKSADALPDIDMDFESYGRILIKKYVEEKYGKENVCSLATYGRLQLRAALKDIGRVSGGFNFEYLNKVTKNIWGQDWKDLVDAKLKNNFVSEFLQSSGDILKIISRCIGQVRHSSVHPAGVIISPSYIRDENNNKIKTKLDDFIPIKMQTVKGEKEKVLVSEWEGEFVERRGLLKIDILGLKQLDIFKYIISLLEDRGIKIDLKEISLENNKVLEKFRQGDTEGIFQFKSNTQKEYQKLLQAENFEHLIASNALLRPGAMINNAHIDYVKIKNGEKLPEYDKGMEKITKKTYGLYIYQEQIMQAMTAAGMTMVEADEVRTIIKKFKKDEMKLKMDKFVQGMIDIHKYKKKDAVKVWKKLEAFSGYGFNRSHSCSYALIGYQCQWLKTYYPLEFWTANLQFADENDRINYFNRIKLSYKDINIIYPDVNISNIKFDYDFNNKKIYWSLSCIKGVGEKAAFNIYQERKKNGNFKSLEDFYKRVNKTLVNKRVFTALIYSGCFDELYEIFQSSDRYLILKDYYKLRKEKIELKKESDNYYDFEFKKLLGVSFLDWDNIVKDHNIHDYVDSESFVQVQDGSIITIVGFCTKYKSHLPKNKTEEIDKMGLITITQNGVDIDVIIWADLWQEVFKKIKIGDIVSFRGIKKFDSYRNKNVLYSQYGESKLCKIKIN